MNDVSITSFCHNMFLFSYRKPGVVRIIVAPGSYSPVCVVRYRESSLHATLSVTLTPCKSMEGELCIQGHYDSFYIGALHCTLQMKTYICMLSCNMDRSNIDIFGRRISSI